MWISYLLCIKIDKSFLWIGNDYLGTLSSFGFSIFPTNRKDPFWRSLMKNMKGLSILTSLKSENDKGTKSIPEKQKICYSNQRSSCFWRWQYIQWIFILALLATCGSCSFRSLYSNFNRCLVFNSRNPQGKPFSHVSEIASIKGVFHTHLQYPNISSKLFHF